MERSAVRHHVTMLAATFFFGSIAWVLLSILFASPARADDADPIDDLLGSVTQPLGGVVDPLASTLQSVLDPVAAAAQPVVSAVGDVAAPVLEPVGDAAAPVVQTVTGAVDAVASAAAPVLDPVTRAIEPVTAPILSAVSPVTDLVTSLPGVDAVVPPVLETVTGVVTPDTEGTGIPAPPARTDTLPTPTPAAGTLSGMPGGDTVVSALRAGLVSFGALFAVVSPIGVSQTVADAGGPLAPGGAGWSLPRAGDPAVFTSSMNALGFGSALALGAFVLAHRAWARRRAPGDDRLPGIPAFPTDASPD